jgi:hypothetical protein
MQNSRIKQKYEKKCEFCETPLKWQEKPLCKECSEALRSVVMKERRSEPYVSDNFQIGPEGAYEHTEWDVTLMDGLDDIDYPELEGTNALCEEMLEERKEKLETLAKLLAKTWFYGDWNWETPNERIMQMLMQELGYYPFKDEDEMIKRTGIHDELYERAVDSVPIRKPKRPLIIDNTHSQIEISNEQIQKAAESQATFAPSFVRGVEWYKEQLKSIR